MTVEIATFISDLDPTRPFAVDLVQEGDDHLRLLKQVLLDTFPDADMAIYLALASQAEAEAGMSDQVRMSPLKTKQAIDRLRAFSSTLAAQLGADDTTVMTPLKVKQAFAALTCGCDCGTIQGAIFQCYVVEQSDLTTPLTVDLSVPTELLRLPAFTLTSIRAQLNVAQVSGAKFTVDIKVNGTTIFTTPLTFDNGEKSTVTAAVPAVIATNKLSIPDDAEITFFVSQVGSGEAAGLKVALLGYHQCPTWVAA